MLKRRAAIVSILAAILVFWAVGQSSFAKDKLISYDNARFHFSFMRPVSFTALEEPANGDGQVFVSEHLKMKISGSGSYNVLEKSALEAAIASVPEGVNYKKLNCQKSSESDVCVTWKSQGLIYLVRAIRTQAKNEQEPERLLVLRIEYPQKNEIKCLGYAKDVIKSLCDTL